MNREEVIKRIKNIREKLDNIERIAELVTWNFNGGYNVSEEMGRVMNIALDFDTKMEILENIISL